MELKESLLTLTKIESSSDYESKKEISTGSTLLLYTLSSLTFPLLSLTLIESLSFYYNIS